MNSDLKEMLAGVNNLVVGNAELNLISFVKIDLLNHGLFVTSFVSSSGVCRIRWIQ